MNTVTKNILSMNQMINVRRLLMILLCPLTTALFSQSVAVGTTTPDSSAALEIASADKGLLIPRMSATDRQNIVDPATGLMVYDSTINAFYYFTGNGWLELLAGHLDHIMDTDGDTKIQTEETADEDIIRFDMAGTEYFNMTNGRLNVLNTGNSVFLGDLAGQDDDLSTNQNVFVGYKSGQKCTTCSNNVSLGYQAFSQNPNNMFIGMRNTAVGSNSLLKGLGMNDNTAIGYNALGSMAGGTGNVAIGSLAWLGNLQGNYGVVIGANAGQSVQNGEGNVLLGYQSGAGSGSHTKARNVMIGYQSGQLCHANDNVFIGYQSGQNETRSNRLYIENTNADSASALIYGEFNNDWLRINGRLSPMEGVSDADGDTKIQLEESADDNTIRFDVKGTQAMLIDSTGKVVIGEADAVGALSVNGEVVLFNGSVRNGALPNANYLSFLGNNDTHLAGNSWVRLLAGGDHQVIVSRDSIAFEDDVVMHYNLKLTNLTANDTHGQILVKDSSGMVFMRDVATLGDDISNISDADDDTKIQLEESADEDVIRYDLAGTEHFTMHPGRIEFLNAGNSVFLGFEAGLNDDFSDNRNAGVGHQVLKDNTTGRWNSALGYAALRGNTTGQNNVAIGFAALSPVNSTGNDNVAIGKYALTQNNSGNNNVAIGSNTALNLSSGSGNVFIGYNVGQGQNGSNRLMIDNSDTTETLIYGEFDNDLLTVNGTLRVNDGTQHAGRILTSDINGNASWQPGTPVGSILMWPVSTPPEGWLVCDGSTFDAEVHPELAALLGGNTLPDFEGRFPLGKGDSETFGSTNHNLGDMGGEEMHLLTISELPSHRHAIQFREGEEGGTGSNYSDINGGINQTGYTDFEGGSNAHNNMPPYNTVQFIIKAD